MRHKHADLIHAWAEGAEVQYKSLIGGIWLNFNAKDHTWHPDVEYRIKPKTVKKWRFAYQIYGSEKWFISDASYSSDIEFITKANIITMMNVTKLEFT